MTFTRITVDDLITTDRLHYQYMDVHSLLKVLNSILKEVDDLKKINMDNAKRDYGHIKNA